MDGYGKDLPASVIDPYFADDGFTFGGMSRIFLSYDSGLAKPDKRDSIRKRLGRSPTRALLPLCPCLQPRQGSRPLPKGTARGDVFVRDALFKAASSFVRGSYSASGAEAQREFSFSLASSPIKATELKSLLLVKAFKGPAAVPVNDISPMAGLSPFTSSPREGSRASLRAERPSGSRGPLRYPPSVNGLSFTHKGLHLRYPAFPAQLT